MAKKSAKFPIIYLIGTVLIIAGFICPMFKGKGLLGITKTGFDFLNFDNFGTITIAGLLIFCGAVLGALVALLKGKGAKFLKFIFILASIAGGVMLFIYFNNSWIGQVFGKGLFKNAYIGFWMICAGWVVGLIGALTNK